MHHILNELWTCIDPGPVYTKIEFGLILMQGLVYTKIEFGLILVQWKRYCALNSTRFGVKNGHNTTRFALFFSPREGTKVL